MKKALAISAAILLSVSSMACAEDVYIPNTSRNGMQYAKLVTTDSSNFYKYTNGRFAFSSYVPTCMTSASLPVNSDGAFFRNDVGTVTLTVSGGFNVLQYDAKWFYENAVSRLGYGNISYGNYGDGWYVISGVKNEKVYYEKGIVNSKKYGSLRFEYPYWQKEQFDWMISELESHFVFWG